MIKPLIKCSVFVSIVIFLSLSTTFSQRSFGLGEPVSGKATIDDAERSIRIKDWKNAEAILLNLVSGTDPDLQRESLYGLGRVYFFQQDLEKAKRNLELALAIKQKAGPLKESNVTHTLAGIYVYLSYIYTQAGDYDKAIQVLKKAADAGLAHVNANSYLGSNIYLLIARNYMSRGDLTSAQEYLRRSLSLKIKDAAMASNLRQSDMIEIGRCYLLAGEYRTAISRFEFAVSKSNRYSQANLVAYIGCMNASLLSGDYQGALNKYADKMKQYPGELLARMAWYSLGAAYFRNNDPREARDYFSKAIAAIDGMSGADRNKYFNASFNLNSALVHYGLGVLYESENDHEKALIELNKTVESATFRATDAFYDKVCLEYLHIAAQNSICEILEATGKKDLAEKEFARLAVFVKSIPPDERSMIVRKRIGVYIEGKSLAGVLKKILIPD